MPSFFTAMCFIARHLHSVAVASTAFIAGCAAPPSLPRQDREVTTYYDQNHDGVVDFELHEVPGMADAGWALSDTKFDGRYDVRLKYGYVFSRTPFNQAVPTNVTITKGNPPVFTTQ